MLRFLVLAFIALAALPAWSTTPPLSGRWLVTCDFYGTIRYYRLDIDEQSGKLTATLSYKNVKLQGNVSHGRFDLDGKSDDSEVRLAAQIDDRGLSGDMTMTTPHETPLHTRFTAVRVPALEHAAPKHYEFAPTVFYRQFSPFYSPVLTIGPGDVVHTTTVDAGGEDSQSVKRVAGGNPQTGPFYIRGAMPGDVLVVHLLSLRLNRDSAGSDDAIVPSALSPGLAIKTRDNGKSIRWRLDREARTASPEPATGHLAHFAVPLQPMLGCIATATAPAAAPPPTGDSGSFGGNMDFNEIGEGATVYLPVNNPGALLYLGDAHARQGDGEINGNALETSADVTFSVDVLPAKRIASPRVETAEAVIALGLEGSLDDALRAATASMSQWLSDDYALTPSEVAQVIGVAAQYKVAEVADRNSVIALKIDKSILRTLTPTPDDAGATSASHSQ